VLIGLSMCPLSCIGLNLSLNRVATIWKKIQGIFEDFQVSFPDIFFLLADNIYNKIHTAAKIQ